MSGVIIAGNTSGSVTLDAPAVSGTTVITLPTVSGTMVATDTSGNVGIGVTPSAWSSGYKAIQVNTVASLSSDTGTVGLGNNTYWDGSNNKYLTTNFASLYIQSSSAHKWYSAPSGTAGNTISFVERMTLDSSGKLLIGTSTAIAGSTGPLQVYSGGTDGIVVQQIGAASNDCVAMWHSATSGNNTFVAFFTEASITGRGSITYNRGAGLTAYNTTSDYRLKENIVDLPDALDSVMSLKPRQFSWKETGNVTTGFIAHELAEVCPHAVSGDKDAVDEEGKPVYQGIDTSFLVATLTAAIQEQQALITSLTARLDALENK